MYRQWPAPRGISSGPISMRFHGATEVPRGGRATIPTIPTIHLSKSKFVAGVQCLKRLYLQSHQPDLVADADPGQEARLEQGQEVGILARSAFPGGVLVEVQPDRMDEALARTAALMEDSSVPGIFEATVRHKGVLVRVDILQRRPRNRWRLIEVKSAVEYKEHYLYDVAISITCSRAAASMYLPRV